MRTFLSDRSLRFDGVTEIEPELTSRFLLLGVPPEDLRVSELTPEITQFNQEVSSEKEIRLINEAEPVSLDLSWCLPDRYLQLDLDEYLYSQFEKRCPVNYSSQERETALERVIYELEEVKRMKMVSFFKTVIYILDKFREKEVIWGVGRGSSCASYLLFILGLHVVDCVRMNISAKEFFHE